VHDITTDSGFERLMDMEATYDVPVSSAITLFFPDTFLTGEKDIEQYAPQLIARSINSSLPNDSLTDSIGTTDDLSKRIARRFSRFSRYSFISILTAGIIDGINPCAIATMIFLISFLATQKRKRSEVLVIGLSFTATVFFTYLLMGIGAFKALSFLSNNTRVSTFIRWSAALLAAGVGIMSLRDAFVYRTTGKAADIKLQLPKPIKMRIHRIISGNLSGGKLVAGAIITGFLVTLLEAVCTGQVYLPTIILMTRQKGLRLKGWGYLILYNILFVLPLLIVMVLAFFGLKWDRLAKTTQRHMVAIKVSIGVLLCSLALFIIMAG
jgi:cytochrome c biogenesis protein CcdA